MLHLPGEGLAAGRVGEDADGLPAAGGPSGLRAQAQGVAGGLAVDGGPDVDQLLPQALVAPALLGHPGRGRGHEVEVVQGRAGQGGGGQDAEGGQVQGRGSVVAHSRAHPQGGGGGAPQVGQGDQSGGLVALGEQVVRPGPLLLLQTDGAQGGPLRGAGQAVVHEGPSGLHGQALHQGEGRDAGRAAADCERRGPAGLDAQARNAQVADGRRRRCSQCGHRSHRNLQDEAARVSPLSDCAHRRKGRVRLSTSRETSVSQGSAGIFPPSSSRSTVHRGPSESCEGA